MRKLVFAISATLALSACAESTAGKRNQTVFDIASAYHLLAISIPSVLKDEVPGVHLSDAQKTLTKKASSAMLYELDTLNSSVQSNASITDTAVSALQSDFNAFSACFSDIKATAGQTTIPASCSKFNTSGEVK